MDVKCFRPNLLASHKIEASRNGLMVLDLLSSAALGERFRIPNSVLKTRLQSSKLTKTPCFRAGPTNTKSALYSPELTLTN